MNQICFATLEAFDGCIASCRNAAAVLGGTWAVIPRHGETPAAALTADLLVLSSWDERYETLLEERRGPTVPRWHSTILQTELSEETSKFARIMDLLDRGVFPALAVNDPAFTTLLSRDGIVFLPDVLAASEYRDITPARLAGVNVSLFGVGHWRKNICVQAAAFERARRDLGASDWMLHLNGQSLYHREYAEWLQTSRIPFVDHGRLQRARYLSLTAAMDVGLCATLSESYCYVAADHVALGVPIVASTTVACVGGDSAVARPDDVDEIARALARTLDSRPEMSARQRHSLDVQARANAETARSALFTLASHARLHPVS